MQDHIYTPGIQDLGAENNLFLFNKNMNDLYLQIVRVTIILPHIFWREMLLLEKKKVVVIVQIIQDCTVFQS